jgi:hypothetical protein
MNRMKYNMGGMTYGDGLKSNKNTPKGVGMVDYFAQQGIEMVEDTLDYSMKRGGSMKKKGTKKGMMRKTARRAYTK